MNSSDDEEYRPRYDLLTLKNLKSEKLTGETRWTQRLCHGVEKVHQRCATLPEQLLPSADVGGWRKGDSRPGALHLGVEYHMDV